MMGMMGAGFFLLWQKMSTAVEQVQKQNGNGHATEEKKPEEQLAIGPTYKLETMIVNLADEGGKRYLRVNMEFELSAAELEKEIATRLPQIRDIVLMILPAKKYADISTTEGKIAVRDEMITKLNEVLKSGKINTIYFTEFVVQ
jgi:flagellar FliL protein